MAVLSAKKLKASLEKAQRVGVVEEPVTIGGCPIVLRSLTSADYEAIAEDTKELEEIEYLHGFQIGHVCRSICEIDGMDLRDIDYIEVDEEGDGGTRTIKLERHAWVRDHILNSWGREAIYTAWRKFSEVLIKAESKAKEGIHFSLAEETAEERFRRLLGEVKEAAEDIPNDLLVKVLDDEGFILKSTQAELESARDKLAQLQADAEKISPAETTPAPSPVSEVPSAEGPSPEVSDLMQNRQPMNRAPAPAPPRPPQAAPEAPEVNRRVQVPEQIREAAISPQTLSRAAQVAALETLPNESPTRPVMAGPALGTAGTAHQEPVEIRRQDGIDEKGVRTILDRPPTAGINPRYQPPRR